MVVARARALGNGAQERNDSNQQRSEADRTERRRGGTLQRMHGRLGRRVIGLEVPRGHGAGHRHVNSVLDGCEQDSPTSMVSVLALARKRMELHLTW